MITATVNGKTLNLPLSFTFELIQQSQLTSFENLKGECIPSISFANTERNNNVLHNPEMFEMLRTGVKEFPNFELKSDGLDIIRGTLVLNDGFSGFVRGVVGNISAQNADKLITDYDLPLEQTFENKTSYHPTNDAYACPTIINPDFFKDLTETKEYNLTTNPKIEIIVEQTVLQVCHRSNAYQVNSKNEGLVEFKNQDIPLTSLLAWQQPTTVVTPFCYLFPIIKKLLIKNNIFLTKNQLQSDEQLMGMLLYNNYNIVDYTIGSGLWELRSPNQVTGYEGHYINIAYIYQAQGLIDFKDLLPPVSLKNILIGVQNLLNIAFVFNNNNTCEIIDRNLVIDKSSTSLDDFFTGIWQPGEKKNIVLEFKMTHDNNDSFFGSYYSDLSEREADFADEVADMLELEAIESPKIGQLRRVIARNAIYEYKIGTVIDDNTQNETDVTGWFFASIDFQNYKYNYETGVDKEVEVIETSFSTLAYKNNSQVMQLGRCNLRRNTEATFTPRVFFEVNGNGSNNSENYYLNWRGTNNLFDTRWKKWAKFWANRESVTGYFRLPAYMLQNFDLNKPYSTRQGSFLIERMVTQFTQAGVGETKIEAYKL